MLRSKRNGILAFHDKSPAHVHLSDFGQIWHIRLLHMHTVIERNIYIYIYIYILTL